VKILLLENIKINFVFLSLNRIFAPELKQKGGYTNILGVINIKMDWYMKIIGVISVKYVKIFSQKKFYDFLFVAGHFLCLALLFLPNTLQLLRAPLKKPSPKNFNPVLKSCNVFIMHNNYITVISQLNEL
jgi:hypothetical protein